MSACTETFELGGLPLQRWTLQALENEVFEALAQERGGWIVTANIDFLARASKDPRIAHLYRCADILVADGQPLLWASRLYGTPLPERVAGADLVWRLARRAATEGRRLYLLGGTGETASLAATRFQREIPEIVLAGWSSPWVGSPPTEEEFEAVAAALKAARPDLVYVALGSPKQEELISMLRQRFPKAWMLGCGMSLGFVAGNVTRAPVWMQRLGAEWLHRLVQEPGRLARRYLINDLPFSFGLLLRAASQRHRK